MGRTYELGLVFEPRQTDDEVDAHVGRYSEMIVERGGTITEVDNWGKRKLAYPVRKFNEGKYAFLFVSSEGAVEWEEIEVNLQQNERVLRHLVVRTDLDLKRAATKSGRRKPTAGDNEEREETVEPAASIEGGS